MQTWIPDFDRAGLRIVALTTDSPEKNRRIATRLKLSIPILSDPAGKVLKKIGMWDSGWGIATYGYYLLDPTLGVVGHYRGHWEATEKSKNFFLEKLKSTGG